jgi:beta-lactamase regulating signal transducer with metallopeptidase domain
MTAIYQSPFLIALGWTIAASIWQSALLWIVYQAICNIHRKITPSLKHFAAVLLLFGSFGWFIATLANTYNNIIRINGYLVNGEEDAGTAMFPAYPADTFLSKGITDSANQYLPYISAAYLIVLLLLLTKLGKAYWHSTQLKTKGLVEPGDHWIKLAAGYAKKIGITQKVQIYLSRHISVPATLSFFKPVILLPLAALNHLSVQQVESIILHELAHIKRNDYLINIIASVIETILFFNPFVHLLGRSLKKEREHCCDDVVLQHRFDPHSYASALLSLEQMRAGFQPLAIAATGSNHHLLSRIKRIMNINAAPFNYGQRLLVLALMTIVMISVAWLSPQAGNNPETFPEGTYTNKADPVSRPMISVTNAAATGHQILSSHTPREKKVKAQPVAPLSGKRKNREINTPAFPEMAPLPPFNQGEMPLNPPPLPPPSRLIFNEDAEAGGSQDPFTVVVPPIVLFGGHSFTFRHDLPDINTEDGLSWWKHAEDDIAGAQMNNAGAIDDLIKQIDALKLKAKLLSQYSQLLGQEQMSILMNKAIKKEQLPSERLFRNRKQLSQPADEEAAARNADKNPITHNMELSLFNSLAEHFSSEGKMRLDSLKKVFSGRGEKQKENRLKKARERNGQGTHETPAIYKFIVHVDNAINIHPGMAKSLKKNIPVTVYTKKASEEKETMKETFSYGNVSVITTSEDKKPGAAAYTHHGMNTERKRIVISL